MCAQRGTRRIRRFLLAAGAGPRTALALVLSVFASLFRSTERLGAKNLFVPAENLILYDQRGLLKGPVSVPDLRFFLRPIPGRAFGVIAKDLLLAHTWEALAKTGSW